MPLRGTSDTPLSLIVSISNCFYFIYDTIEEIIDSAGNMGVAILYLAVCRMHGDRPNPPPDRSSGDSLKAQ